jgi:carbamoyl-phosphate synthase small subunit
MSRDSTLRAPAELVQATFSYPATPLPSPNAVLVLEDGEAYYGWGIGKPGEVLGELCFNTAMTGYQEVLTDPSYAGQLITFTFPHIGNVGCNGEDIDSTSVFAAGLIVREPVTAPDNYRAESGLCEWLNARGITGICGVDTRRLTRHIRLNGAKNAVILHAGEGKDARSLKLQDIVAKAAAHPSLNGAELAGPASTKTPYVWNQSRWKWGQGYAENAQAKHRVVAIDYGCKLNILRHLSERGCEVTVVPATSTAEEIFALNPDGVFLSNGPGDPAATAAYAVPVIQAILAKNIPLFGICLGHQLLALALGGKTTKMHQGHRGANHPIKNHQTGTVEITSQNHGFVVDPASLPAGVDVTHSSLFDGTVAGLRVTGKPVFSVQYHPEASPGPHDSGYLFDQFIVLMREPA